MTIDRGWIRTVYLAGVLLSVTGNGLAQERSKAYLEVVQGAITEFESGNYAEARVLFEQAHGMRPSARTLRGIGLASFELKEYVRAEQELGGPWSICASHSRSRSVRKYSG